MFENRNIGFMGTPYDPEQIDKILRNGLDALELTPDSEVSPGKIIQIPLRLNGTPYPQTLKQIPEGCIAFTKVIVPVEGSSWTTADKLGQCVAHLKEAPFKVLAITFQLLASRHFGALFLARREDPLKLNVGFFNPEGVPSDELLSTLKPEPRARYQEFMHCVHTAAQNVGMGIKDHSFRILQEPRNDEDKSCGPRVVSAVAHALLNPKTMCSRGFTMGAFTAEMAEWDEGAMRNQQAASLETGITGRLKTIHSISGPDHPTTTKCIKLYQRTPVA